MTSILMDLDTGDLVLDDNNNTIEIEREEAFTQILAGLLLCERGSEYWNPEYGFPLTQALRESYGEDVNMFIESLVVDTLNPQVCKLINKIDYVEAQKDGNEVNVLISVTAITGEQITFEETLENVI